MEAGGGPGIASILERLIEGKAANDFVFVSPTGLPIHNADFYTRVWQPLAGDELIADIVDTVLKGQQVRPPLRLVQSDVEAVG